MSQPQAASQPRDCPYFGLDYYEEEWGAWFFGREAERNKIITNLRASPLTPLHANSGVGKSSLLRAGVVARLQELAHESVARRGSARYVPVVFSSWRDDPIPPLITAIGTAIKPFLNGRPHPILPPQHLDKAIQQAADAVGARLFIILDQFEEYFNYSAAEPTPERLASEVARCINQPDLPANFLISIREDAYAGLGDLFKGRIANVYGNYLTVDYLDREAAESAIRKPILVYNEQPGVNPVEIDSALVGAVLDQVGTQDEDTDPPSDGAEDHSGNGHVETPLLQLVMERVWKQEESVWERAPGSGTRVLRHSTLDELKGVETIVDTHLGDALDSLDKGERAVAIDLFRCLVTGSGGKIAESVPDLADRTARSEEEVREVLAKLDHERIVRPVAAPPGRDPRRFRRYEIFHDVLAPAINRVITASREERLATEKEQADERARQERERAKRFRALAAVSLVLMLVAVGLGAFSFVEYENAVSGSHRLNASKLALAADVNAARDPQLGALLALRSLRIQNTGQGAAALRAALPQVQALNAMQNGPAVNAAVFDPVNSNRVASAGKDGVAWLWNVKTGHRLLRLSPAGGFAKNGAAYSIAFNSRGTEVAVGYGLGSVALYDTRTGQERNSTNVGAGVFGLAFDRPIGALAIHNGAKVVTADGDGIVRIFDVSHSPTQLATLSAGSAGAVSAQFSPGGDRVVAAYTSGTTRVWDTETDFPLTLLAGDTNAVNSAQFSADGREAVTASDDGTIRVWYAQPRELRYVLASSYSDGRANQALMAQYSANGSRLLVIDQSNPAYVFNADGDPAAPDHRRFVVGSGMKVDSARFNLVGTRIVTAESDGTVRFWDATTPAYKQVRLPSLIQFGGGAQYAAFSPDPASSRVVVVTDRGAAEVWNDVSGKRLFAPLNPRNGFSVTTAAFSPPTGQEVYTGDADGQIEVWNGVTGHWSRTVGSAGGALINDLEFNSTGARFVTAAADGTVTVRYTSDPYRRPLRISACPTPNSASFSPDNQKLVVACGDGSIPIFDAGTGAVLTDLRAAYDGPVNSAAFSPDGRSVVAAFGDRVSGGEEVWNTEFATSSLSSLRKSAEQRVTGRLTNAERVALTGAGS